MGVTVRSRSQTNHVAQKRATGSLSLSAQQDVEGWAMIILPIPIGLLALGFFLALGGIFAIVGPWMVLAAAHLIRRQWARKAAVQLGQKARGFVVAYRHLDTAIQANRYGGKSANCSPDNTSRRSWLTNDLLSQPTVVA